MKAGWRAVALGIAAYLFFLLISAPASAVLSLLQPQLEDVEFLGVSGSIWSGAAVEVSAGEVRLSQVSWRLRPLAFFKGALEADVDARFSGQPFTAKAGQGLFSGRYLTDVSGRLPMVELLRLIDQEHVGLDGEMDIALERVVWSDAPMPAVAGSLSWVPATVSRPIALNLGEVSLVSTIAGDATEGQLRASGGALTVDDGRLNLQPDGNYQLAGTLRKQGVVPQQVDQFLSTFAEFRDGGYWLEWSDQLP